MANMTRYLQKALIDHLLGFSTYTVPDDFWLSLHTAVLDDAGSLAAELSTTSTGYGRVSINAAMEDATLSTGIARNDVEISIGPATADWGIVAGIGFCDAETGGNMLFWAAPTTAKLIVTGLPFEIPIHNMSLQLN